jgi:2-polyprenyl-3-methyl-5-hydroxy-6-metoxy-1,4-benzoquinol methylase
MTELTQKPVDRDNGLTERNWWDLWNTSYRSYDGCDEISTELFANVTAVIREVTQSQTKRILEVACGTGTLSRQLEFSNYHGLDVSPAAVGLATEKSKLRSWPKDGQPTYEVADIHDWSLAQPRFDVVVCVDAVAYFYDQTAALKRMAQSLAPSGRLVLTTINPFVYNRIRRTQRSPLKEGSISHWLTRGELHKLVSSAGFELERSFTIMPRGNMGILRFVNARRLNKALGSRGAEVLRRCKEQVGLGQYRVIVAHKEK